MLFVGEFPHRASEGCPAGCVLRPKGMQRTGCGRQSDVYLHWMSLRRPKGGAEGGSYICDLLSNYVR